METWVFGPHAVWEALQAGRSIEIVYIAEGKRGREVSQIIQKAKELGIPLQFPQPSFFKGFSREKQIPHQGVAAKARSVLFLSLEDWFDSLDLSQNPVVLLLDHLQDPHNVGAIIRTAAAFGVGGIIFPKHRTASLSPAAERAAAGGQHHVPLIKVANIAETVVWLQKREFVVVGTVGDGGEEIRTLSKNTPICLVFGAEHEGIHRLVKERCDLLVQIPMSGKVESLNVSVAAGIFLWEVFSNK